MAPTTHFFFGGGGGGRFFLNKGHESFDAEGKKQLGSYSLFDTDNGAFLFLCTCNNAQFFLAQKKTD